MKYNKGFTPAKPTRVSATEMTVIKNLPNPAKPRQSYKHIDSYEFTKVWMTSDTLNDVAEKLEIPLTSASMKATGLRKRGVKLPKMSRRPDKNSVEELNKLVERYAK